MEGDKSVARLTLHGKHTGQAPTLQAAPTGKQIEMPGCVVSTWKNGKIVQEWVCNDYLGLVQQFGVIPLPGLFAKSAPLSRIIRIGRDWGDENWPKIYKN